MPVLMTIFAHQDDETFSAGGVLAKYASIGKGIAVSVTADPRREKEFLRACSILGVEGVMLDNTSIYSDNEESIKMQIMDLIRQYKPDHIISHIDFDYHHEHRKVRQLVDEAIEWVSHTTSDSETVQIKSLWAAETTVLIPFPQIYIDITDYNELRMKAIESYESQSHKGGYGFYSRFHGTRTKLRGIQAEVEHAEAYLQIPIALAGSFKPNKVYNKFPF